MRTHNTFDNSLRQQFYRQFTLVELLVVIAIISILAAILLPALSRARQTTMTISCANNMKQMGAARSMYSNDYDGYFLAGNDRWYKDIYLGQYLGNKSQWGIDPDCKVLQCPSASGLAVFITGNIMYDGGYGAHTQLVNNNVRIASIKTSPSQLATFVDGMSNRWFWGWSNEFNYYFDDAGAWIDEWGSTGARFNYSKRHNRSANSTKGICNVLFLDGHVNGFPDLKNAFLAGELTPEY